MENNEKLTLSTSQIAQMNFNQSLDLEVRSTIKLIIDFLKQENTDLKLIAQKSGISVTDLKQLRDNLDLLEERPFNQVAKLKKLAAKDLVKTSVQRFPFLIKLVQDTDKDTVDYSGFLKEWTKIIDSFKDKKQREVFDEVIRQHPLELMAIVREIDHRNWLD